jgi:hypothetical protein
MCHLPIEFHGDPELAVVVVQIASTPAHPAEYLPYGAGQSVAPLNAANVVPLQYRVNTVTDVGKRTDQPGAPSKGCGGLSLVPGRAVDKGYGEWLSVD